MGEGNAALYLLLRVMATLQPVDVRKANFKRYRGKKKKECCEQGAKGKRMQEEWKGLKGRILTNITNEHSEGERERTK